MSKIQWTDETWNPVTGCSKVSAGCKNCYAERDWSRVYGDRAPANMRAKYGVRKFTDVRTHGERLDQPVRWQKPRLVFVNSMSDLFHEHVPDEFIAAVFGVMAAAPQHTFQVLTKRPERMRRWFDWCSRGDVDCVEIRNCTLAAAKELGESFGPHAGPGARAEIAWPLPNVWLGVSCENQEAADERIPMLLDTPAAVRFVSAEPLLGPIDFEFGHNGYESGGPQGWIAGPELDWVIAGGESGPGARPCDVAWIRRIVEQCKAAGVACFVKQLGAFSTFTEAVARFSRKPESHGECRNHHRDRKGGDPSEWPVDLCVREFPEAPDA